MLKTRPYPEIASLSIALFIASAFVVTWYYALFRVRFGVTAWWQVLLTWLLLEFLYTGLFITTHDAMHGSVSKSNKRLNDFLGALSISMYAWFDYGMLFEKHWEHHDRTGLVDQDPDFHGPGTAAMLPWFARFMATYVTPAQLVKLSAFGAILSLCFGVPIANQAVFMAGAGLASAFRLFYFGTYEPHRPNDGDPSRAMPWEASHSSKHSRPLSFLKCYHFDYHWEHHRWPDAPWWMLPSYKNHRMPYFSRKSSVTEKVK